MVVRVRAERQLDAEGLFDTDEQLRILDPQALEDARVHVDAERVFLAVLAGLQAAGDRGELALQLDRHRRGGLHHRAAAAVGAAGVEVGRERLLLALAGHLHDAERRDGQDVRLGLVLRHELDHAVIHRVAVAALLHVDVVHDHEAADVAEPDLARDLGGRLHVDLEDGVLLVAGAALVGAGVDVDGDEGLGLVDHDLAAGGQRDAALEGLLDLALDVVALEDRDGVLVIDDLALGAAGDLADVFLRALEVVLVVDEHAVDVLGEEVADGALDDVGLLVEAGGGAVGLHLALDLLPLGEEEVQVADEVTGLLALAGGADDDAHALGNGELVDEGLEALALGRVLDLAGDAAAVGERREDEVAAGEGEVRRGARALGADGALGDLDDDLGARRVEAGDVLDGGLGLARAGVLLLVDADDLDGGVGGGREHVPVVEEGVLVVADVDEGGLEAGVEVLDAALVDAADHAGVGVALDLEAVEGAVDEERDALLEGLGVDDELAEGALLLPENAQDFLEDGPVGGAFLGFLAELLGGKGLRVLLRRGLLEFLFMA